MYFCVLTLFIDVLAVRNLGKQLNWFPVTNLIHLTKTQSHLKSHPYSVSQNKSGPISVP